MSENRLEKKRAANRRENMSKQRLKRKRDRDRHENMTEDRLEKRLIKNRCENISEIRVERKRTANRHENMPQDRIIMHRIGARSKLHVKDRPSQGAIDRLAARREKARMANRLFQMRLQKEKQIIEENNNSDERECNYFMPQEKMEMECLAGPSSEKNMIKKQKLERYEDRKINDNKGRKQIQYSENNIMLEERIEVPFPSPTFDKSLDDIITKKPVIPSESMLKSQFVTEAEDCFTKEIIEDIQEVENIKKNSRISRKSKKYMELAGDITKGAYFNVEKYEMGELNLKCFNCGAVHFVEQKGRTVHTCCQNGKITLPPLNEYPPELESLLKGDSEEAKHFRDHIRAYNSSFGFATFGAHIDDMRGRGPPLIKIQGQVYHHATTSLVNMEGNAPRNGQIYIYEDIDEAAKMRLELKYPNLTRRLENLLRNVNPYAQKYKMLHEMTKSGQENYMLQFIKYAFDDKRRYNKPTSSEVAMIIVSKDGCVPCADLKVYPRQKDGRETTILSQTSQHADPMTFPLLFPHGDLGWTYNMFTNKGKKITPLQYYGHRLSLRPDEPFNPLLNAGRLTQQYVINCYVMIERQRLDFIRHNQSTLRMECYQGIVDHIENNSLNEADKVRLGTAIILPATYIGSPRCLQQLYQDSMAICRKVGRPDFFITMTCNPKWPEIKNTLEKYFVKGSTANDIPMIVTDVFQAKVNELLHDLIEKQVFGPTVRGFPLIIG